MSGKAQVKDLIGDLPFLAELYWLVRNRDKKAFSRFNLDVLKNCLPELIADVKPHAQAAPPGRKLFLFASLHYWITHLAFTGFALHGLGHRVSLGYLPYSDYSKPINKFDLRRNDLYAREVLQQAEPFITSIPFLDLDPADELPEALISRVENITRFDTRYILQCEDVSGQEPIYLLRAERNLAAARRAFKHLQQERPDVVIVPNGMIQEFGAVYETARFLDIPVVTYEFGEQDQRVWLGKNNWVIHHHLDALWAGLKDRVLNGEQRKWLEDFLAGRQKLTTGTQFAHLWQKADRAGAAKMRASLGLDERPVILLPTNVLGDSATLGLTVFSSSMTDWLERLLPRLAEKPEVQVVIRIHPGETLTVGPSVMEVVQRVLPVLPAHMHVIGPSENVNTYDLMELADLALVYTTTAGLEMALRGIPVLLSGQAHYRGKGFTLDADTWEEYFSALDSALGSIRSRLSQRQVEVAWNYAYLFFAEYPLPFPWHVEKMAVSMEKRPLSFVLGSEGRQAYERTFQEMVQA